MYHGMPPRRFGTFLVYVFVFHILWIGWAYLIYPWLNTLGSATMQYALVNLSLRVLIWLVPVFMYLRWIDQVDPFTYLKLKHNWQRGLLVGLVFTGINLLLLLARFGAPHPSLQAITPNSILNTSILIGIIEEIPYRGFMLQKFHERFPFWLANLITSLLFVCIHLPGWIALHLLRADTTITIFLFSLLMGLIFHASKSLWSVISAHSLNDFLSSVVFGR